MSLAFLPVLPLMLLVSESPRWLLATGKQDRCKAVMTRVMRINGITKDLEISDTKGESLVGGSFLDLFRTPMLRRTTIVMSLAW